jgi:iron complex outermembrane receptor protein
MSDVFISCGHSARRAHGGAAALRALGCSASTIVFAGLLAGAAQAAEPAATGAAAQATASGNDQSVAEVVVTAEFRAENLQAAPLAITAVNAQMLEQRSQTDIAKVAAQAPNVTLIAAGGEGSSSLIAFIRGVGQVDFNFANEPGVGVYVDDVYYSTLAGSLLDLLDLNRVEILRGPQGTLAGKNSIGGAIRLFTQRPTGDNSGYLEVTAGSLSRIDARGAADFALVPDKLMVRISAASKNHDGYVTRIDYACSHPGSGLPTLIQGIGCKLGTEGGQAYAGGRIAIRWLASDHVEVNLAADGVNDRSEAVPDVLLQVAPGDPTQGGLFKPGLSLNGVPYDNRFVPFGPHSADPNHPNNPYITYAGFNDPAIGRFVAPNGNNRDPWVPYTAPAINHFKGWGISGDVDWRINDDLALKSITAYRWYNNEFSSDTESSPIGVLLADQTLEHWQFTQEARFTGTSFNNALDWVIGGFVLDQHGALRARVHLPWVPGLADLPTFVNRAICGFSLCQGPLDFIQGDLAAAHNYSGFGHAIWRVTDKFDLDGGVRFSAEDKTYTYHRYNVDGTVPLPCHLPPQFGGVDGSFPTPGFSPNDPPNCSMFGLNGTSVRFPGPSGEAEHWDYRAAADYHFTPDAMGYFQVSTGYKGGGVNPRPFFVTQEQPFGPETLTAYELGAKTQWFDHRLTVNLDGFYENYAGIQISLTSCPQFSPAPSAPCFMTTNAGDAHVGGFEAEAAANPIRGLLLDASLSYLNFKYYKLTAPPGGSCVTLSDVTPYTPSWKWSFGAQYEIALPGMPGTLTPRVDGSYQSSVFTDPCNYPNFNQIKGYALFNARLTWRSPDKTWEAALEITNFTDQLYYTILVTPSDLYEAGTPGMPREFAVTIKKRF